MSRFLVYRTPISGLYLIERKPHVDDRGYFERLFCPKELEEIIGDRNLTQINHTLTRNTGVTRGMHYQNPPYAEMKLVSCLRGEVFDVAVDLRQDSPTFLKWHSEILSDRNHRTLCIPEGFAHGFQTLTKDCELLYLHSAPYAPEAEAGLNALDGRLSIEWPLPITERSQRDTKFAFLQQDFPGLAV